MAGTAERERRTGHIRREIDRLAGLHQRAGELGTIAGRQRRRELSA